MKRGWLVAGIAIVALLGIAAVAQARGPQGFQGGQPGQPGYQYGGCWMDAPGSYGAGRGMMGGWMMGGRGMMGGWMMGGQFAEPAALAEHLEVMIPRHESVLATLEERLAEATEEAPRAILTRQVEWHKLMLEWMRGRLAVAQAAPAEGEEGLIAIARFDVDFFTKTASEDEWVQAQIENRLLRAQNWLDYLTAQADGDEE